MRKIIIGGGIFVVLLIAIVLIAVSNINGYLEENREELAAQASAAAGRTVVFDRAEVAFSSGLAVRLAGLQVSDDPRFGTEQFLTLDEAYVGVRIWPALQNRIEVSGIRFDAPTIRVIQTSAGFNFSSLGASSETADKRPAEAEPEGETSSSPVIAIALLEIVDGTIVYQDRTSAEGLSLVIEDFNTSGTDLSLDGPLSLDFAGRVHSAKKADKGLESDVTGEVDLADLQTMTGKVHLQSPSLHPAIFGVRLEEGDAIERLDDLVVDVDLKEGLASTGIPVSIRSSAARLSGFDLNDIAIDVDYRAAKRGAKITLEQVVVGLAGGSVQLAGDLVLGKPGASPFDLTSKIQSIDSGELAAVLMGVPRGALTGNLGGDVALKGDSLEWESLKKSLVGSLRLDISEGALEQVNVLSQLVTGLTTAPGFGQLAAASIRDVAPDALSGDRTAFEGINMALEILDGSVQAKDLSLRAGDFVLEAIGKVGLDGAVAADGKLLLSEDLSRKILKKADRLAPLLGEGGQVALPLQLGGTTADPTLIPDLTALTGKAQDELKNRAVDEISNAIFGKNRDGDSEQDKANRSGAESLLKEGLGRFLGR